jgi:hypothetical protein
MSRKAKNASIQTRTKTRTRRHHTRIGPGVAVGKGRFRSSRLLRAQPAHMPELMRMGFRTGTAIRRMQVALLHAHAVTILVSADQVRVPGSSSPAA